MYKVDANDMELMRKLDIYQTINPTLANCATTVVKRHFWYEDKNISISLFSKKVPIDKKKAMTDKLLTYNFTSEIPLKSRNHPKDILLPFQTLIGLKSILSFQLSKIDKSFFKIPPRICPEISKYIRGKKLLTGKV